MSTRATAATGRSPVFSRIGQLTGGSGRFGDRMLLGLCGLAGLIVVVTLADVVYQLVTNAKPSISRYGLGFLTHALWQPNFFKFGVANMIYGTLITSACALLVAGPLGVAIALYLSMIASPRMRTLIGPLVEMLAAVPSIILGLWGFLVLAPFIQTLEPALHSVLGFIPLFGPPQLIGISLFAAVIVLTLMMLPIVSALCRDLFLTVPQELMDGAAALGATRWEVIRGIVLPSTISGVTAAMVLGLGRALGEAIAVSLVIGDVDKSSISLFKPGQTLAGRIAIEFQGVTNAPYLAALFYAALVLLVIGLITSLAARAIAGRFDVGRSYGLVVGR